MTFKPPHERAAKGVPVPVEIEIVEIADIVDLLEAFQAIIDLRTDGVACYSMLTLRPWFTSFGGVCSLISSTPSLNVAFALSAIVPSGSGIAR